MQHEYPQLAIMTGTHTIHSQVLLLNYLHVFGVLSPSANAPPLLLVFILQFGSPSRIFGSSGVCHFGQGPPLQRTQSGTALFLLDHKHLANFGLRSGIHVDLETTFGDGIGRSVRPYTAYDIREIIVLRCFAALSTDKKA